jgi:hypothetical protein
MSKKSKRQARNVPASTTAVSTPTPAAVSAKAPEKGFNPDYSPVIKDLKRIGTLAGTFFLIMIVLSFILK